MSAEAQAGSAPPGPARGAGAGAGVNEVEVIPRPRAPLLVASSRSPAALEPGVRLSPARPPRRGPAMAKRSSLSIRIVEGKNLPAKDM
jgi:hypothetical protein